MTPLLTVKNDWVRHNVHIRFREKSVERFENINGISLALTHMHPAAWSEKHLPFVRLRLITLRKKFPLSQTTLFTTVSFNQKALCTAVIDIQHVITVVKKPVNSVPTRTLTQDLQTRSRWNVCALRKYGIAYWSLLAEQKKSFNRIPTLSSSKCGFSIGKRWFTFAIK